MQQQDLIQQPAATASSRLSLEVVRVATPCDRDWETMDGDQRMRFCSHCGRYVHNLSAMTTSEVEDFVCRQSGPACIRYTPDAQARVTTLDYRPFRAGVRGWRFWTALATAAAVIISGVEAWVWRPRPAPPKPLLGAMLMVPPSTAQPTAPE